MKKLRIYYAYIQSLRGDRLDTFRTPVVAEDHEKALQYVLDPKNKIADDPCDVISVELASDLTDHTICELNRIMSIGALSHCISDDALIVLHQLATEYLETPEEAYRRFIDRSSDQKVAQ